MTKPQQWKKQKNITILLKENIQLDVAVQKRSKNKTQRRNTAPPKPASQFLLGSTPTQEEPLLGCLVLRHMRF